VAGASFTGSISAPSIVPNGATVPTNGMYLSATNTLAFATSSTRRARIDGAGQVALDGTLLVGQGVANASAFVEIGLGRTADGNAYLDFISDATTYTDYGSRFIRTPGSNGSFVLEHRGTGGITLRAQEAASITLATNNITRLTVASDGSATFAGTVAGTAATLASAANGATSIG
jgi:hypothetical protein